jgi:hypothetical protein
MNIKRTKLLLFVASIRMSNIHIKKIDFIACCVFFTTMCAIIYFIHTRSNQRANISQHLVTRHKKNRERQQDLDVVITFVDGSDPYWLQSYRTHVNNYVDAERFQSYGEIYLCLSSVFKFIPWINRVFVVISSESQAFPTTLFKPQFRDKIRFVTHKEFIPQDILPTFSSLSIEAYIHNIPDLSENILYLNDDMFLSSTVMKDELFIDGKFIAPVLTGIKVWMIDKPEGWHYMYYNTFHAIGMVFGMIPYYHSHEGYFLTKTGLNIAWNKFHDYMSRTAHHNRTRYYMTLEDGGDIMPIWLAIYSGIMKNIQIPVAPKVKFLNAQQWKKESHHYCRKYIFLDIIQPQYKHCLCLTIPTGSSCKF